jgi:quinol monooxygenase YgiN
MTKPLQHVVLMKFEADLPAEDEQWARAEIASWPARIGGFRQLRFGRDLTGARNRGNQYLLFEEFDDHDSFQKYLAHPVHQEFQAWVGARNVDVTAFDYFIDGDTDMLSSFAG